MDVSLAHSATGQVKVQFGIHPQSLTKFPENDGFQ